MYKVATTLYLSNHKRSLKEWQAISSIINIESNCVCIREQFLFMFLNLFLAKFSNHSAGLRIHVKEEKLHLN